MLLLLSHLLEVFSYHRKLFSHVKKYCCCCCSTPHTNEAMSTANDKHGDAETSGKSDPSSNPSNKTIPIAHEFRLSVVFGPDGKILSLDGIGTDAFEKRLDKCCKLEEDLTMSICGSIKEWEAAGRELEKKTGTDCGFRGIIWPTDRVKHARLSADPKNTVVVYHGEEATKFLYQKVPANVWDQMGKADVEKNDNEDENGAEGEQSHQQSVQNAAVPRDEEACIEDPNSHPMPCGNCGHHGHQLKYCIHATTEGTVPGCPLCNTVVHDFDTCPDYNARDLPSNFEHMVIKRGNMPRLRTKNHWCELVPQAVAAGLFIPACFPWTDSFSASFMASPARQATILRHDWDSDTRFLPCDPATASLKQVKITFAGEVVKRKREEIEEGRRIRRG